MFTSTPAASSNRVDARSPSPRGEVQRGESQRGLRRQVGACLDERAGRRRHDVRRRPTSARSDSATAPSRSRRRRAQAAGARRRRLPLLAHVISGVSPVAIGVFGLAPAFEQQARRARRCRWCRPATAASCGSRSPRSASAPARTSRSAVSRVVPVRRPQQRRRAVLGPGIHVSLPGEQRPHLLRVLILRGLDEPEIASGARYADSQEQRCGDHETGAFQSASFYHRIPCSRLEEAVADRALSLTPCSRARQFFSHSGRSHRESARAIDQPYAPGHGSSSAASRRRAVRNERPARHPGRTPYCMQDKGFRTCGCAVRWDRFEQSGCSVGFCEL